MNAARKYYDVWMDVYIPKRWQVTSPVDERGEWILPREFFQGKPVHLGDEPLLPLFRPGLALDYTVTESGVVVLNQRLATLLDRLCVQEEFQLIPARVEGQAERHFILNTLRIIRCVDEARCEEVAFWEPRHGEPERVGQYRNIYGLKIDPAVAGDANIFRPWGYTTALIFSERIKHAMEEEGIKGARFVEV